MEEWENTPKRGSGVNLPYMSQRVFMGRLKPYLYLANPPFRRNLGWAWWALQVLSTTREQVLPARAFSKEGTGPPHGCTRNDCHVPQPGVLSLGNTRFWVVGAVGPAEPFSCTSSSRPRKGGPLMSFASLCPHPPGRSFTP